MIPGLLKGVIVLICGSGREPPELSCLSMFRTTSGDGLLTNPLEWRNGILVYSEYEVVTRPAIVYCKNIFKYCLLQKTLSNGHPPPSLVKLSSSSAGATKTAE
ncbi:hypothetical protein ACA910_020022 [Epithemia clementina (nom. ined.)]